MARILEYPLVRQVSDKEWRLEEELEYHVGSSSSLDIILVEKGFITDFASVPRIFWNIFPPFGKYSLAAIIHDWLYKKQGCDTDPPRSRKSCDGIFLEAMEVMGVGWWTRHTMYRAVRMFGWAYW